MLSAVFEKVGKLSLKELEIPEISKSDEVKIKVVVASICGTDVHILANPPTHPATPGVVQGHEYIGEIVEVGSKVEGFNIGDRVLVDPTVVCGNCYYCKTGIQNLCENFTTLGIFEHGGWASHSVVPAKNVYKISKSVPAEIAVFAEPLSCVINGSEKINTQPGDTVVILGAGPMGQLFTQVQKAAGAGKIIVVDLSDYRLDYALKSGATHTVNPRKETVEDLVFDLTEVGADLVIDCVGMLFDQTINLVRKGGKILLVGMNDRANNPIKQCEITSKEITVKGTIIQNYHFPKVVKVLESNILNLESLITHKISLKDIHEGIETMKQGEAIKIMVYPE